MIVTPSNMKRLAEQVTPPAGEAVPGGTRDAPGKIALDASHFGHVLQWNLLVMASKTAEPQARLEAAERVFQVWRPLCVLMSQLEGVCPNASEAGYGQAAALAEIAGRGSSRDSSPTTGGVS